MQSPLVAAPLILPVSAFLLLWCALSVLSAWVAPWVFGRVRSLVPHQRSLYLLGFALYPVMLAVTISLIVFAPGLSEFVVDHHCHDSACGVHVPILKVSVSMAHLLPVVASLPLLAIFAIGGLALWRSARTVNMLALLARPVTGQAFRILESNAILACCAGLLYPAILISRGLLERASQAQLDIILLHERAHRYRFDNLRAVLVRAVSVPWPETARARLLTEVHLAAEQSCDYAVSRISGNAGAVADTLEAMGRWQQENDNRALSVFDDLTIGVRIRALQRPQWRIGAPVAVGGLLTVLLLVQIVVMVDALHHVAEAVLRFV